MAEPLRRSVWVRVLALLLVFGGAHAAAPAPSLSDSPALDSIEQRVKPCTSCHGNEGRATREGYFPRIAGKPAGYLFNELTNFRDGRRHFPIMTYMSGLQSDDYLHEITAWFGAQRVPYPPPRPPKVAAAVLDRGRQLVTEGDRSLNIPACKSCHGSRLVGVAPAVPGLLGVSQDYLTAQLGAWRMGIRAAVAPDCMSEVVHRMRPDDLSSATAWLASQPVPDDAQPDSSFENPPPLKCGSIHQGSHGNQGNDAPAPATQASSDAVARGRQLVVLGDCKSCHTARGGAAFAGGRAIPTPFGTFYSPNLTSDSRTGLGSWSATDFWNALHNGYSKSGNPLYPTFPYTNYTKVSRNDSDAIYAYLRTIAPVSQPNRAHELRFPYNYRALLIAWRWLFFRPGEYEPDPGHNAEWNRGAYLARGLAHCSACHEARNALGATESRGGPTGGLVLNWYAPSLASPREAGVQHWSEADIVTLLKVGIVNTSSAHASALGPMGEVVFASLQHVPDSDLKAMAVYLKSLPTPTSPEEGGGTQVQYEVPPAELSAGKDLYAKNCADCHGNRGQGREPAAPPLAGNRAVTLTSAVNPIRIVLFGGYSPGTTENPRPFGMPPYSLTLSDEQIAEILTYVRRSWGNAARPVRGEEVSANRGNPLW